MHMRKIVRLLTKRLQAEDGFAMMVAIGVMIFGGVVVSIMVYSSIESSSRVQERKGKVYGQALADNAVNSYLSALRGIKDPVVGSNRQLARENAQWDKNFTLREVPQVPTDEFPMLADSTSSAVLTSTLVDTPGLQPVNDKGATLTAPSAFKVPKWTMRVNSGGATIGYWQVARVEPPLYGYQVSPGIQATNWYRPLAVYFRAWMVGDRGTTGFVPAGTPTEGERAVVIRAEYRPSYFSDFQYVTDDVAILGPGTTVNGHVHSNGFLVSREIVTPPTTATRVWSTGGSCTGGNALITTARGDVAAIPGCTSASVVMHNGHYLNIAEAAETAFAQIAADDTQGTVVA